MTPFHFFYSDDTPGHRHVYFHKETYEPIPQSGPWPRPSCGIQAFHTFYFPPPGAHPEILHAWFVDGEWSRDQDHPTGFSCVRDGFRRGWHVVLDGTRYAIVQGLFRGETVVPIEASQDRSAELRAAFIWDRLNVEHHNQDWFDINAICQRRDDASKMGIIDLYPGFTDAEICDKWAAHQRWIEATGVNRPFLLGNPEATNPITDRVASQAWKRELVRRQLRAEEDSGISIQMNDVCADDV